MREDKVDNISHKEVKTLTVPEEVHGLGVLPGEDLEGGLGQLGLQAEQSVTSILDRQGV